MRKNINSKIEREIAEVLGHSEHKDMSVDEVLAMMLQVFLPVLMVFIISYFLFKSEVSREIQQTQEVYKDPIVANQRQTLINALDKLENRERRTLGLLVFSRTSETGKEVIDTTGLISEGRLVENELVKNSFITGCSYAKKNIPFPEAMAERWFNEVINQSGVSIEKADYKMLNDPKYLDEQNRILITSEIQARIKALSSETNKLQSMAISELQKFYLENIDSLDSDEISKVTERAVNEKNNNERIHLYERLQKLLKEHARSVFKSQGVELLNNF